MHHFSCCRFLSSCQAGLWVLVFLFAGGITGHAQSDSTTWFQRTKANYEAKKERKLAAGQVMFTPVVAPAYTPELGLLVAAGGLITFKTNKNDSLIQRSSLPGSIGYTTTGALVINGILTSFWFKDKLRINGDFWYKDMPDHYWGVGFDNGLNVPKSDSTTAYNRTWWWINPRFLYQVKTHYFVGLNVDYNYTQGTSPSAGVDQDSVYQHYNNRPMNGGLGVILRYDTRDVPVDARKGLLLDFRAVAYSQGLGGDNNFQTYRLDYRQFVTLKKPGHTLAWQFKTRLAFGEVPYGEMSQLGTPFDLRGYQWGRYRNDHMVYLLTEYRHSFYRPDQKKSLHGAAVWVGAGSVFNNDEFEQNRMEWLPNVGLGYRFEVQPRMNVRIDYGFGLKSSGFYFNFNQAF
ncbi:BamA/TamA family outer membrane protein [bacterium SCSIO 12741]|nr:BamA/TamA family outer membrane protein [bacterium SCSIO 12741]